MEEERRVDFGELGIAHLQGEGVEIDLSCNQIFWAPNGTGKSSICAALAKRCRRNAMLVDRESCLQLFKRANKRPIKIGTSAARFEEYDDIDSLLLL